MRPNRPTLVLVKDLLASARAEAIAQAREAGPMSYEWREIVEGIDRAAAAVGAIMDRQRWAKEEAMSVKAVAKGELRDKLGRLVPMEEGPCLFCHRWVEEGRDMAGCTDPLDPAWQVNGDFGCDRSPITNEEGTGDHVRPYDVALMLIRQEGE